MQYCPCADDIRDAPLFMRNDRMGAALAERATAAALGDLDRQRRIAPAMALGGIWGETRTPACGAVEHQERAVIAGDADAAARRLRSQGRHVAAAASRRTLGHANVPGWRDCPGSNQLNH